MDAPRGVTDSLRTVVRPTDRVFDAQPWGSWFEFSIAPTLVFVDSRFEVIPAEAWTDYQAISAGTADWSARLDRWGVTVLAVAADAQKDLIPLVDASAGWRRLFSDSEGAVYVRADRAP